VVDTEEEQTLKQVITAHITIAFGHSHTEPLHNGRKYKV